MRVLLIALLLAVLTEPEPIECVTRRVSLMGTSCTLTVWGKDRVRSIGQLEQFIRELEDTERELSTWQEGSVLTALNRWPVGVPFDVDANMCRLFAELLYWVSETGAAFDPGIGALIDAWGIRTGGRIPSDFELKEARLRSGLRAYSLDFADCRITRTADVRIDCGAFGKGEALDRLRSIALRDKNGVWLVDLGGQVIVQGIPPATRGWDVSIAHPRRRSEPALSIRLDSGSLATSGGSERNLRRAGQSISHILDPRAGRPVEFAGSVSVWHKRALIADILSTALYVMGPNAGLAWAEARGVAACYLLAPGNAVEARATRVFRERFLENKRSGDVDLIRSNSEALPAR